METQKDDIKLGVFAMRTIWDRAVNKKRKLLQYVHGRLWSGSSKVSGRINSKDVASGQIRGDELQLQKTQASDRITTEEEKGITDKAYPPLLPTLDP